MFLHQFLPWNTIFISSTLFPIGVWVGKKNHLKELQILSDSSRRALKLIKGCFYPKIRYFDGDFLDFGKKGVFSCCNELT